MEIINIRHMKNLRDKGEITKDEYYHEIMESVKVYLRSKMRLEIISVAGNGEFGDVIAKMHKSTEELIINVISNEISERKLIEDWPKQGIKTNFPKLKHQNILKILHTEYLPQLEVHLFFTPNQPSCLKYYLEDEDFINDPGALQQVEKWIREILDALEYLHSKNYCHLSLMINRILISANSTALLSHFYCLDSVNAPSSKYDVQHEYKPPETCPTLCGCTKMAVDGVSFDIWSFGVFALQIFTGRYIEENIPMVYTNWRDEIYPVLYKILQKNTFMEYLKEAFPACRIENEALEAMINMITTCLRILPEDRPSASLLKCHKYFKHGGYLSTDEDAWIREGGGNTTQIIIYSCLENIQQIERIPQPFPPNVMTITKKSLSRIEESSDLQISVTESENQMNELDENEADEVIQPAEMSSMSAENIDPLKSNEIECSAEQINPLERNENEQSAEYISASRTNESTNNSKSTEEVNLSENDNKSLLEVNMGFTLEDLDPDYIRDFLRRTKPTFYTIVHSEDETENKTPGKFSRWISYEKIYLNKPVLKSQPVNNTIDQSLILSDLEDESEQSLQLHPKSDSHDIYQTEDSNVQITAEDIASRNDKQISESNSSQNSDEPCEAETDQIHSKVTTSKKKRKNPVRRFFGRIRKCCLAPFVCCCRKTNANN